jgi:hypothetical protein
VPGGGIFSRLLQFGIIPLADVDFDQVCLQVIGFAEPDDPTDEFCRQCYQVCVDNLKNMEKYGIINPYLHITNYVLDQYYDDSFVYGGYLPMGTLYSKDNPIENSARYQDYKRVLSKLTIRQEIYQMVNEFILANNITTKTLGVHFRLTTMNMLHHDLYQQVTFENYLDAIKQEFDRGKYENIFVASDNDESIAKLIEHFGNKVIYHKNFTRFDREKFADFFDCIPEYEWFYHKTTWQEAFRDCMVLSRCGAMVCRESNFSNMAIVFSDTFNKVVRVYK